MVMLLSILVGAAALVAYSMFEKRINQRACPECGFTMAIDAIEAQCPRCDSILGEEIED
jgi:rubrerythrin